MTFKRGLEPKLLECLLKGETWWLDVMQHEDLAIAIRHRCLNIYSKGQSIFEVKARNNALVAKTHFKILLTARNTSTDLSAVGSSILTAYPSFQHIREK